MSVESFKWDNGIAEWAMITNRYGKLLSYNLPRYNRSYATCKYQGYITEMLESNIYPTFVDVGAYIGLFSLIASYHCRRVVAYEAHPFYFGILLFNMRKRHVECKYCFVSDFHAFKEYQIPKMTDDIKSLIVVNEGEPYNIEVVTLDSEYGFGIPGKVLIKLDVEGNELNVLKGSEKILKKHYIHWIIDVHLNRGITSEEVLKYFPKRKITMISPKV
ncbi:hypothetical protein LCGC14_2672370, partial [marine sediment metagenome]